MPVELSEEERQRIYLEEKARLEARQRLVAEEAEKQRAAKAATSLPAGWQVVLAAISILVSTLLLSWLGMFSAIDRFFGVEAKPHVSYSGSGTPRAPAGSGTPRAPAGKYASLSQERRDVCVAHLCIEIGNTSDYVAKRLRPGLRIMAPLILPDPDLPGSNVYFETYQLFAGEPKIRVEFRRKTMSGPYVVTRIWVDPTNEP